MTVCQQCYRAHLFEVRSPQAPVTPSPGRGQRRLPVTPNTTPSVEGGDRSRQRRYS